MEKENTRAQGGSFAAQKSNRICPAVINTLKTGVICFRLDEDLTFLWGNTGFFTSTHYKREEFHCLYPGLKQYYADYPEDFTAIKHALSGADTAEGSDMNATVRLPLKGGGSFRVQLCGSSMEDMETGGMLFQAELSDVEGLTAKKEEQVRLCRQKLQYFQWMMDTYDGNAYISDMHTYELLYLNKTACETLHTARELVMGKKCYEVIQGRSTPCPFCTNDRLREDAFYEWEFDNPVLEKTFMIKDRIIEWDGRLVRLELSHDMQSTEYKLAKKDRERDAIIRTVPGGFARVDARDMRTVLWYGGGFLDLIGYTREEFEKVLCRQCTYVHPDDIERASAVMQNARNTGKNTVVEGRIITGDGTIKILTMTYSYVSAEDSWDGIPSFYSAGIDVTKEREEQARQRQALEDAFKAARVANDAKTNFLSSMSHDIRTPMNAIMGMAVIAEANLASREKVKDCLDKINVSSRHLLNLINEVLDMSKIESGKMDLASEVVTLPDIVEDVMNICRPLVNQKKQELRISAEHVRHEKVITDRNRLQQVLMNLLSNAVKYTPEGGTIGLLIREEKSVVPGRGQYEFIVSDNGIGMSDEFMRHIFEPFTRAEDSRISKTQGTGLGMTITENIVRMMNGTIEVKSRQGKGSQFIIAVAFEQCEEEESYGSGLAGLRVLVVDDDRVVCESASELLKELGMRADWACTGRDGIARVIGAHDNQEDYFSIILDWKMPEINGPETVRALRENLGMQVPIIIISAYDYSDIEAEFRLAGADAFLGKPLFKSRMAHTLLQFRQKEHPEAGKGQVPPRPVLSGKRVLLVEDNELNREIAAELLQMNGFQVDEAADGQQAVDRIRASAPGKYDCILMDIQMPVMDGYQATAAIRSLQREDVESLPIFALTANAFTSDLGKAHNAGMNDHIAKPIEMEHLMEVLGRWLG